MLVKYSSLNRLEVPKLTLCSPGSVYKDGLLTNTVGILTDHEAEEIVFNFNSISELNFRINKIRREDAEDNAHTYALYRAVQNRRLIFVDDIGYFMITNIEDGYSESVHYKDVSAQSIDVEIQQKMIPYIEDGTYRFTSDETGTNKGIIETIVEVLPLWTIGYVDDAVSKRYRTFEGVDTSLNCLGFLMDNVQDAYECIFVFDIINRIINVYDQANYVRQTDIHLTKEDLINSLDITENADDLYTAISVMGDENVTIAAINPTGTNVIYNFDFYLDWMSETLREKVKAWEQAVENAMTSYYDLNLQYYDKLQKANELQMDFQKYAMQITMYTRCRNNVVAESDTSLVGSYNTVIVENGGTPIEVYPEIADTLEYIDDLIAQCESKQENVGTELDKVNEEIDDLKTKIKKMQGSLSITKYFTEDEYSELSHYIFEGSYTDEYVTITDIMSYSEKFSQMKILYDRAKARLERVSQPTQEFSIDAENFIFIKEFQHWSEQLETGCLINVELETDDIALLFLSNITINYDDHALSMTFGNRFNKFDPRSLFDDVLGDISKSANTLNYIKEILYPIKNGEFDSMKEALQTSRNLTMSSALASEGEEVLIDGSGYTGKKRLSNGTFDPRQVKLTGRTLVFTDDAWESCKVALGELIFGDGTSAYGINAETIIGDMFIGHNVRILDKDGNDLFTVVDGKIKTFVDNVIYGDEDQLQPDGSASIIKQISSIEQKADGINIIVEQISVQNPDGTYSVDVDQVTTRTGYTFNADGLTIYKSGEEIKNLLDNTGMYVTRSGTEILTASNEGVSAINLTARQYLIVGANSRLEDYSNGTDSNRTACFYIGA